MCGCSKSPGWRSATYQQRLGWPAAAFIVTFVAPTAALRAGDGASTHQPTTQPAPSRAVFKADEGLDDLQLLNLEVPTVVSATRHEQKINTLPYAVSVITKEDIRLAGARNVPDALRLVPGMDVADLSYGNAAVSPRGLHGFVARSTLVLVDGRQIFDSLFGGTVWGAWPFMLEDIERIEVIRGPGGVTWGANAVNGVINIITKDPAEQQGFTDTTTAGSRGTVKEYTGYGIKVDKLRLRASGEYESSDGFRHGGSMFRHLDDDYRSERASVHMLYEPTTRDKFTLSGAHDSVQGGYSPPSTLGFDPLIGVGSQASYLLGRWNHQFQADNNIELTGYVNDFGAHPGMRQLDYRYQQFAAQVRHTFKPAENHLLTWGFDSRTDLLDGGNADPELLTKSFVSTAILGGYIQDEWRFAPRWTLNLGARADYEFYGGFEPSARAALTYELSRTSMIYGAVSRAFQMPPAAMRFVDEPLAGGLMHVTADQDVHAIPMVAYEVGYRGRFFDKLDTGINLFSHNYDDFTVMKPGLGPPGLMVGNVQNGAKILTYGLEWEGRYAFNEKLNVMANYTFELTDWQGPRPMSEADLQAAPKHKFRIGPRYSPIKDLHFSGDLYWVGGTRCSDPLNPLGTMAINPYTRVDLRAEYDFWKEKASLAVGVRNLLDPDHPEGATRFLNNAEVPRMVYAEVRIRLDQ